MSDALSETPFDTARLYARPYVVDDAEDAFEMYGNPEFMRHLMGAPVVPDMAAQRAWLAERVARFARMPRGYGAWALVEKAGTRVVGTAILRHSREGDPSSDVEIGWHIAPRVWGRGYASECGRALLEHGHGTLGVARLIALIEPENARSIAVARRIGMTPMGLTTTYYEGQELSAWESVRSS